MCIVSLSLPYQHEINPFRDYQSEFTAAAAKTGREAALTSSTATRVKKVTRGAATLPDLCHLLNLLQPVLPCVSTQEVWTSHEAIVEDTDDGSFEFSVMRTNHFSTLAAENNQGHFVQLLHLDRFSASWRQTRKPPLASRRVLLRQSIS